MKHDPPLTHTYVAGDTIDELITSDHFGTNFLFTKDKLDSVLDPDPDPTAPVVIENAGVTVLRYPGGTITEQFFDISNPDSVQSVDPDFDVLNGNTASDLTPISEFLDFCDVQDIDPIIVIPTYRFFDPVTGAFNGQAAAKAQIQGFVEALLAGDYGDVSIKAFEIGNEWYNSAMEWTASEFGYIQAKIAKWIHNEIGQAIARGDIAAADAPDIYAQTGRDYDVDGSPNQDDDGDGLSDNQAIYDEMDAVGALNVIDGLVNHFYVGSSASVFAPGGEISKRLDYLDTVWDVGGNGFDLIVTEWNVGDNDDPNTNYINGLMRSLPLMRAFVEMHKGGVDVATIWANQAGSAATLSSKEGVDAELSPTGYLFRMLGNTLEGLALVDGSDETLSVGGVEVARTYMFENASESKIVSYYVSGVDHVLNISVDFSGLLGDDTNTYVFATVLGAANGFDADDYYAEGRIQILTLADLDSDGDGVFDLTLNPYELIQIEFITGEGVFIFGDDQNGPVDVLEGTDYDDEIHGGKGGDTLRGWDGDDIIFGGVGHDTLRGDDGDDVISGGEGNDIVHGGKGADVVTLGKGNDIFYDVGETGSDGSDIVDGGNGQDTLNISGGNNQLTGGNHADTFVFHDHSESSTITDFNVGEGDKLKTDIAGLTFADLHLYNYGGAGRLKVDVDNDGTYDFTITLEGVDALTLTAADFIFV